MIFFFFKELYKRPDIKEVINLDEIEKLQIAIDIADAVYFLHNLTPVSINHSAILDVKF